jgi:hypothetical protein
MRKTAFPGFIAGLLFIGTGLATLLQTGIALQMARAGPVVLVTLAFAAIAFGAGAAAVRLSLHSGEPAGMRSRITMVAIGVVGLAAWAGVIVGPVLAFVTAIMPRR